jgi:hypothetical protein
MKSSFLKRTLGSAFAVAFLAISLTACTPVEEVKQQRLDTQETLTSCTVEKKKDRRTKHRRWSVLQTSCGELRIEKEISLDISKSEARSFSKTITVDKTYDFVTVVNSRGKNVISASETPR